jgi:NADH-quinone oxidoreductase subunit H
MNFLLLSLIKAAIVAFVFLTTLAYLQWAERKILAHVQIRVGPRRVGPHGLLQPLADVIKLMTKEDMIPSHVSKLWYLLAPFLAVSMALIPIAVIPFGSEINAFGVQTGCSLRT